MTVLRVRGGRALQGGVRVPGDKSISHRALILGALARGVTRVRGWLAGGDTLATLAVVRALGVSVETLPSRSGDGETLAVHGGALRAPGGPLDCANAGTTMRLMAGLLAGQPFESVLDGSAQLRRRPMRRVVAPLQAMGAAITDTDGRAPLHLQPARLYGIHYEMPVASAQLKSALLLAGLHAEGETVVVQPGPARDHTERMLRAMGADIQVEGARPGGREGRPAAWVAASGSQVRLRPGAPLAPLDLDVPGDFSSAAFLIAAGVLAPGSDVVVEGVNLNPTRTGLLDVLARMGAAVSVERIGEDGEPAGVVRAQPSALRATAVGGDDVVRLIDEFPILAVAATQASGVTEVCDAAELRVKEVDRIAMLAGELRRLGAQIEERVDGFVIEGPTQLRGAAVDAHGDHRLAMSLAVAGLIAEGETMVHGAECIADSFPGFVERLWELGADVSYE